MQNTVNNDKNVAPLNSWYDTKQKNNNLYGSTLQPNMHGSTLMQSYAKGSNIHQVNNNSIDSDVNQIMNRAMKESN